MKKVNGIYIPDNDTFMAPFIEKYGTFETDHLDLALQFVSEYDVAIDGGGNIGCWALHMAKFFRKVYSFEAADDTFECLSANTIEHTNINAIHKALGYDRKHVNIMDDVNRPGNLGARYVGDGDGVEMVRIDDFNLSNVGLLKLDIEGYELEALKGAELTIKESKPVVIIEVKANTALMAGKGDEYLEPVRFLEGLGMTMCTRANKDCIFVF